MDSTAFSHVHVTVVMCCDHGLAVVAMVQLSSRMFVFVNSQGFQLSLSHPGIVNRLTELYVSWVLVSYCM